MLQRRSQCWIGARAQAVARSMHEQTDQIQKANKNVENRYVMPVVDVIKSTTLCIGEPSLSQAIVRQQFRRSR